MPQGWQRIVTDLRGLREARAGSLSAMGVGAMGPVGEARGSLRLQGLSVAGQLDQAYVGWPGRPAESVPHGRAEIVQRAGHSVHQERPDAFARVLATHLEAATAAGGSSSRSTLR